MADTKTADLLYAVNGADAFDASGRTDPVVGQTFHAEAALVGSHTESLVDVGRPSVGGYKQRSFVDDFYNRVHFRASPFSFGSIVSDSTRSIYVWNAHLVANTLNSMAIDSGINVAYAGGALPIVFAPLEELALSFTAYKVGTPTFAAFTVFSFDLKDPYNVLFVGDRSALADRGPDWSEKITEVIEFKTEIVNRSRSGREQRRALRQEPRRSIAYQLLTSGKSRRDIEGLLTRWRRRTVSSPMWPWRAPTTTVTAAAASTLNVASVPSWASPGANVAILHPTIATETGVVASTGAGTITLESGVAVQIPAGAAVTLMLSGRLRDGQTVNRLTADVATVPVVHDITPGLDAAHVPAGAGDTHDGYEIFPIEPNWKAGISEAWDLPLDEIDAQWGVPAFYEFQNFVQYTMTVVCSGTRDLMVEPLFDFFWRQRGQQGEFWFPTGGRDIELGYQLDMGAVVMRVVGTDFARDWADQTTNQAVIFRLLDGTRMIRNVVNVSTVTDSFGTDSVITVDDPWPYDIATSDIRKISWLMRARFATDTLRIDWLTDAAANAQFSILTLEAL